ncbi:MAG TPA: GntR family transcriptional regulator [Clostridiaceae bacterium]
MNISLDDIKPIYLQISEGIEDDILKGILEEKEQALSTNQFAAQYQINPATAAKGINDLVEVGILYKKRGLGMFVAVGARKQILEKRKKEFFKVYITKMLIEAEKLGITKDEIFEMIKK